MSGGTHNAPAGAAPDPTILCAACGYDLRGFGARDRCPECGTGVVVSLVARVAPAAALDPAWRRQVHEAAVLSLSSLALVCASMLIPIFGLGDAPGSRLELVNSLTVLSAAGWALQWWSTLKLCRTPRVEGRKRSEAMVLGATRALATFYMLVPLLAMQYEYARSVVPQAVVDASLSLAGPLCAVAYYLWLGAVFRRFGAPGPAAQAVLLAAVMPVCLLWFRSATGFAWGPTLYAMLPSYQHGLPAIGGWFVRALLDGAARFTVGQFSLPAVISLCGTYLHVRLLLMSRKRRGEWADRPPVAPDPRGLESRAGAIPSASGEAP